jgi:cytochrome b involved in lipid metabolism
VSGDSAAAYLLQTQSQAVRKAGGRLGALTGHLDASSSQPSPAAAPPAAAAAPVGKTVSGEFTAEEVAKHNKKDDVWVIIDGQVLDVTSVS